MERLRVAIIFPLGRNGFLSSPSWRGVLSSSSGSRDYTIGNGSLLFGDGVARGIQAILASLGDDIKNMLSCSALLAHPVLFGHFPIFST